MLTDAEAGKIMTISLWETREQIEAVEARAASIRDQAILAAGLTTPPVETYEVRMHA